MELSNFALEMCHRKFKKIYETLALPKDLKLKNTLYSANKPRLYPPQ